MTQGKMIYLIGSATKLMEDYMKKNKTYEFTIVCGISTDSQDCMGIIQDMDISKACDNYKSIITGIREGEFNSYIQKMPVFSAYKAKSKITGERKALWEWTRLDRLDEVDIPESKVEIDKLEVLEVSEISLQEYIKIITDDIKRVTSFDKFTLDDIIKKWQSVTENHMIPIIRCRVQVKSGVFIRYLVNMMGNIKNIPTHVHNIHRTDISL
jgi:tRNA U55 pseudouridine synthase TruB